MHLAAGLRPIRESHELDPDVARGVWGLAKEGTQSQVNCRCFGFQKVTCRWQVLPDIREVPEVGLSWSCRPVCPGSNRQLAGIKSKTWFFPDRRHTVLAQADDRWVLQLSFLDPAGVYVPAQSSCVEAPTFKLPSSPRDACGLRVSPATTGSLMPVSIGTTSYSILHRSCLAGHGLSQTHVVDRSIVATLHCSEP